MLRMLIRARMSFRVRSTLVMSIRSLTPLLLLRHQSPLLRWPGLLPLLARPLRWSSRRTNKHLMLR